MEHLIRNLYIHFAWKKLLIFNLLIFNQFTDYCTQEYTSNKLFMHVFQSSTILNFNHYINGLKNMQRKS